MYKKIIFLFLFILVLGIAYYGVSPIFQKTLLDEPIPKNDRSEVGNKKPEPISTSTSMNNKITPGVTQKDLSLNAEMSSNVKGTTGHLASGVVKVIILGNTKIIRYENFKTINGPDLYVYLSKDLQAKDFVSLGRLKAAEGNINYEVSEEINLKDYSYVIVWCKTFGVLFNSADISKLVE